MLPALKIVYHLGTYSGYDYEDPAWRYGLFSQELHKRQVSHISDPRDQGVVADGFGCSVFTNLGGHPIPYHEYLSHTLISIPKSDEMPRAAYEDIWKRPFTMDLRTVFYDIVPFPPPEYHAVVNTTYAMYADLDHDGKRDDFALNYPANKNIQVDVRLLLKSHSNFDPLMPPLEISETLIAQGMFKGLGFRVTPGAASGSWFDSWSSRHLQGALTETVLTTVTESAAYDFLCFQQWLQSQRTEAIDITATLQSLPGVHKEGVFKINDGARFVYHQKALGPNRYEVFDHHTQAVFGLSADPQVVKQVAPVRVATYDDTVYHFIEIADPYDPRMLGYEPQIQSYGFGDMAATVYVGGRRNGDLLFPRVQPGGRTQVRIEINNNTGVTLTSFAITPVAPSGITVTLRPTIETLAIGSLFFDFPYLHQTSVPDAWKTVWYFDVQVASWFTRERGLVYPVRFNVSANGLTPGFAVPDARIGVEDASGNVGDTYGQAVNLQLADRLPPWMTVLDARIANADEMRLLANALALGQDVTATQVYSGLRDGITTTIVASSSVGTHLAFTLPPTVTHLPWIDNGKRDGVFYVIVRSHASIKDSGTTLANYGPVLSYTDPFSKVYTVAGNQQTVEAHGAVLVGSYVVNGIEAGGVVTNALAPGMLNVITVTAEVVNHGDYIARATRITLTLGTDVGAKSVVPSSVYSDATAVAFDLDDMGPAQKKSAQMVLTITPTIGGAAPGSPVRALTPEGTHWTIIRFVDGQFINEFVTTGVSVRQAPVKGRIADALRLGNSFTIRRAYLPCVALPSIEFPLRVGNMIPTRPVIQQGETFYTTFLRMPTKLPSESHYYFSSRPDSVASIAVDDVLAVKLNGTEIYTREFVVGYGIPTPSIVEVPQTVMQRMAGQTITVEYRDMYGRNVYASDIWLIWVP